MPNTSAIGPKAKIAWAAALLLSSLYIAIDIILVLRNPGLSLGTGAMFGRDFANVATGGRLVLSGALDIIYDIAAYRNYQELIWDGAVINHNYSYPPVSFLYTWIFGLFDYSVSYLLWNVITGGAFFLAARPYLKPESLPAFAALLLPAGIINMWAGHYGFLVGALWLGAWRLLDERPRAAGLLVGLMIVKPHLALLMPIALARRGAWTAFAYAGLTAVGLVMGTALLFGWQYWWVYLTETSAFQATMVDAAGEFFLKMMPTVIPSLVNAGLPVPLAVTIQVVTAICAVAALWAYMPRDSKEAGLATACATFLVLPYAFIYDMTVPSLAAAILLGRRFDGYSDSARLLIFLVPLITIPANIFGIPLAPVAIMLQLGFLLWPQVEARTAWRIAARST